MKLILEYRVSDPDDDYATNSLANIIMHAAPYMVDNVKLILEDADGIQREVVPELVEDDPALLASRPEARNGSLRLLHASRSPTARWATCTGPTSCPRTPPARCGASTAPCPSRASPTPPATSPPPAWNRPMACWLA